jgi:uncharacterized protein GlcG (DUF336 family)
MKRRLMALAAVAAVGAVGVGALQAATPNAQVNPQATKTVPVLRERNAERIAQAAMQSCADKGFPVSVVIVDRDGIELVVLRDEDATGATVATALGKARASAGFRTPSGVLDQAAKNDPGLTTVPDFVLLAGGEPITTPAGDLLGGIGVSGAPSGDIDDSCALSAFAPTTTSG